MDRLIATYRFGLHVVGVVECLDDDGVTYRLVVDGRPVDGPMDTPPCLQTVVRRYAELVPNPA